MLLAILSTQSMADSWGHQVHSHLCACVHAIPLSQRHILTFSFLHHSSRPCSSHIHSAMASMRTLWTAILAVSSCNRIPSYILLNCPQILPHAIKHKVNHHRQLFACFVFSYQSFLLYRNFSITLSLTPNTYQALHKYLITDEIWKNPN